MKKQSSEFNLTKNDFYTIVNKEAMNQKHNPHNSCNITLTNIFKAIEVKTGRQYTISQKMQIKPDCKVFGITFGSNDHLVTFFKDGQYWIMIHSWQDILALWAWIIADLEAIGREIAATTLTPFTDISGYVNLYMFKWVQKMTELTQEQQVNDAIQSCRKMFDSEATLKEVKQFICFE